jgi:hypothetical protein
VKLNGRYQPETESTVHGENVVLGLHQNISANQTAQQNVQNVHAEHAQPVEEYIIMVKTARKIQTSGRRQDSHASKDG